MWRSKTEPVRGRTSLVSVANDWIEMRDSSPHARHGTYGIISGNDGSSFLNHGKGWAGMRFPKSALNPALEGYGGLYGDLENTEQTRGLWRVNTTDPKVITTSARADGLTGSIDYLVPNGPVDCDPASYVFSIAANWGILLRLFVPRPTVANRRYGVCGFRSGIYEPQPLSSPRYMRMAMISQVLRLQGYRAFTRGPAGTRCWGTVLEYDQEVAGIGVGIVPIGEVYTLRLWGKAVINAGKAWMRWQSNHGLDYLDHQFVGIAGGWIDVGYDASISPNLAGGSNTFPGSILEIAGWNHPDHDYLIGEDPWIATADDDVSAAEISASPGLEFYYRLDDPSAPNVPVVSES
jgi:hypothetical protein